MGKMTEPQTELLREAALRPLGTSTVREYRPAQRLVLLGFAEWGDEGRYGSSMLRITDAGRKALEAQDD